jgi:hypothetical protein
MEASMSRKILSTNCKRTQCIRAAVTFSSYSVRLIFQIWKKKKERRFDPTDFDIDAFIVSYDLAGRFRLKDNFRSGAKIREIREIQRKIENQLRARSEFQGLRFEKFTFRIFNQKELKKYQNQKDSQVIFSGNQK